MNNKFCWISWFLYILIFALPINVFGGAWTVRKDSLYMELYSQYFWNDADFNNKGERVKKPKQASFDELRLELKGEFGILNDRINFLFSVPYEMAKYEEKSVPTQSKRTEGFEEIHLGVKYRFTSEPAPVIFSLQLMSKFPLCDKDDQPPLADCQNDFEMRLLFSRGLLGSVQTGISRFFMSLETGYRFREQAPADEIAYFFELGYNFFKSLWIKHMIDGVESRPFGDGIEEDFLKTSISFLFSKNPSNHTQYNFPTVELGYGQVVKGKNTGAGQIVFLNIAYLF